MEIVERLHRVDPVEPSVQGRTTTRERPERLDGRAGEGQEDAPSPVALAVLPDSVELGGDLGQSCAAVGEVLELVDDEHGVLGRLQLQ